MINRFLGDGISVSGGGGNTILGNFIGTDVAGIADLGNGSNGISIDDSPDNTIGGLVAGARNVISGNGGPGLSITGGGAMGNLVVGNYIGTDVTGTVDVSGAGVGFSGVDISDAPRNTIGGLVDGARNVISGNDGSGVLIRTPEQA